MKDNISVIIPTLNGGELFHQLLKGLFSQDIDCEIEVVVIDSGSSDQTIPLCNTFGVKLLQIPSSSFSHSSTRNLAIYRAKNEICVLTVQDAVPADSRWLAKLVAPMRNNNRVAGVFGQQISRHTTSSLSRCCKLLWYREWRGDWRQEREQGPIEKTKWEKLSFEQKKKIARFDNVNSCIRKSVWGKIPLPEVPYAEDLCWAVHVLTSGYSIFWQPNARVYHSHDRPLAYEFKRSYVDMKSMTEILGGSPPRMTAEKARHVFDWIVEEARLFLEASNQKGLKELKESFEIVEMADSLWQSRNKGQHTQNRSGKNRRGIFPVTINYKRALHYYYRFITGPKWFRMACRNWLNSRKKVEDKIFLPEMKGRHRFYLNQLLEIYYSETPKARKEVPYLRFGAAIMVAGSLLGESIEVSSRQVISPKRCSAQSQTDMMRQETFWTRVDEWYHHDFDEGFEAVRNLDQILKNGV